MTAIIGLNYGMFLRSSNKLKAHFLRTYGVKGYCRNRQTYLNLLQEQNPSLAIEFARQFGMSVHTIELYPSLKTIWREHIIKDGKIIRYNIYDKHKRLIKTGGISK